MCFGLALSQASVRPKPCLFVPDIVKKLLSRPTMGKFLLCLEQKLLRLNRTITLDMTIGIIISLLNKK